jgi:hypothetical protein
MAMQQPSHPDKRKQQQQQQQEEEEAATRRGVTRGLWRALPRRAWCLWPIASLRVMSSPWDSNC